MGDVASMMTFPITDNLPNSNGVKYESSQKNNFEDYNYFAGFRNKKYNSNLLTYEKINVCNDIKIVEDSFPFPLSFSSEYIEPIPICAFIQKDTIKILKTENDLHIHFVFDSEVETKIDVFYCVTANSDERMLRPKLNTKHGCHFSSVHQIGMDQSFDCHLELKTMYDWNSDYENIPIVIQLTSTDKIDRQTVVMQLSFDTSKHATMHSLADLQISRQYLGYKNCCFLLQDIFGIETQEPTRNSYSRNEKPITELNTPNACDDDNADSTPNDRSSSDAASVAAATVLDDSVALLGDSNMSLSRRLDCVVCMSNHRDTLVLPCRHLCLCHKCGDKLLYQSPSCPICRSTFRALLQLKNLEEYCAQKDQKPISDST